MKGDSLLECLKRSPLKDKWITAYQARQMCGYGGGYVRDRLEEFAERLTEVERRKRWVCRLEYKVDPPSCVDPPRGFDWWSFGLFAFALALNFCVGALAQASPDDWMDNYPCEFTAYELK